MSQTLLFEIGAVIFFAVATAAFLYGRMEFRDWQDRDDTAADGGQRVRDNQRFVTAAIQDSVVEATTLAHRPDTKVTGNASRPSTA